MADKFLVTRGDLSVPAGSSLRTVFAEVGESDSVFVPKNGQAPVLVLEMSGVTVPSDFL